MLRKKPVALFLFAHQDDEFGVFQKIIDEVQKGSVVHCAYLTNGSYGGVSPSRRNQESLNVLSKLGVQKQDIVFAGFKLSIPDGCLPEHLVVCSNWIRQWLHAFTDISAIYVPAWEGGHQDHDALHALTVGVAQEIGILKCVRQFPLYNSYGCPGTLFKVFHPLSRNGVVIKGRISLGNRLRFLRYCLSYPSQAKTWLGLFPFVLLHYLTSGSQKLQVVSSERVYQRPHEGKLYYEKRGFFEWEKMESCLAIWRTAQRELVKHL